MSEKKQKKKKEKIVYIDDGSTVADMSAVGRSGRVGDRPVGGYSSFKDKAATFWNAVKLMVLPMLIVLGFLTVCFIIMMLISGVVNG